MYGGNGNCCVVKVDIAGNGNYCVVTADVWW